MVGLWKRGISGVGLLKQDKMTRDERMIALMKRQPIDRIPFGYRNFTGFSAFNCGYTMADMFTDVQKCFDAMTWTAEQYGWQMTPMIVGSALRTLEWGGDIKWPTSPFAQAPIATRYPVITEDDVWNLKTPDVTTAGIVPRMIK